MEDLRLARVTEFQSWHPLAAEYVLPQVDLMCRQDVHLYYSWTGPAVLKRIQTLKKLKPGRDRHYGETVYPPIVVEDLDDNIDYVHPLNPEFVTLGTRLVNGKKLKPGQTVFIDFHGEKLAVWEDGKTYGGGKVFDIQRNLAANKLYHKILRSTHGLCFSTERLRQYYEEATGHPNTYSFPNSVIFDDYERIRTIRDDTDRVRILWQGGDSHYADWYGVREAIGDACQRLPEIKWVIWGSLFKWITNLIPDDQFEYHEWVPYSAYKLKLAILDFDIAVAPLVDNVFNRGKSCIKFYEAAALPDPKPTLAANVPPYSDEIQDGVTGMLYSSHEEFVEKLGVLAQNPTLRKEIAINAQDWIRQHRDARVTVPPYYEWMCETRARLQTSGPLKDLPRLQP